MARIMKFLTVGGALVAIALVAQPLLAAVTRTNDNIAATSNAFYPFSPQNATYGVTTFNMTGANTAPKIQIIPDNEDTGNANNGGGEGGLGLQAGVHTYVGEGMAGANPRGLAQTFTPTSNFKLGAIALIAGGPGSVFTDSNSVVQTMPLIIHLYDLTNGYTTNGNTQGGNPIYGGYIPSTAAPGGDMFGGGSGLSFTTFGQPASFLELNFTGADSVTLQAGHHYAFEMVQDFALSNAAASSAFAGAMFPSRESGGAAFYAGNPYPGGDGYAWTSTANNDTTSTRGNLAGSGRDFFMAIYESNAVVVPPNPGDVNLDGIVNQTDLNLITGHWLASGQLRATGDLNSDGLVNQTDLNLCTGNWLGTGGTGSFAAVPEPASLVLLGLAAPAMLWAAVRKRR